MGYYPVYKEETNCNMMRNTSRSRNTYLLCFIDFDRIKELCSDFLHGYKMMPQGFHIGMSGLWHICHIKQTMRQWNTYSYYSYIHTCSILKICLRLNTRNIVLKIYINKNWSLAILIKYNAIKRGWIQPSITFWYHFWTFRLFWLWNHHLQPSLAFTKENKDHLVETWKKRSNYSFRLLSSK